VLLGAVRYPINLHNSCTLASRPPGWLIKQITLYAATTKHWNDNLPPAVVMSSHAACTA